MFEPKPFFDYSINEKCFENNKYEKTIRTLYDLGYRTIAINQVIEGAELESKKRQKKGESKERPDPVPEPYKIIPVEGCEDLKILNRLTVVFGNHMEALHKITRSERYKKYHIIAALPTSPAALSFTYNTFEADIFCFNHESKYDLKKNRKIYGKLIERGFHFEIPYSPAIEDSTSRKNIINVAHLYHSFAKSRNIIVSSWATNYMLIRGPYDVINLGFIFGLNEQQAKNSISYCGRQVYLNSVSRRQGKSIIFIEKNEDDRFNNVENKDTENEADTNDKIIDLVDSDEDMEVNQPAQKKVKQSNIT